MRINKLIIISFLLVFIIFGCGDDNDDEATLNIQFRLAPGATQQVDITRVVVTITGPDIDSQEFELKVEGRKATGIVSVPSGEERTIKVKAYAGDVVEFEGEGYVDHPKPGTEIPLVIQLKPTRPPIQEEGEKIFDNGNIYAVYNNPTAPTIVRLDKPYRITKIFTYHWNNGRGATPGTIALKDSGGKLYGPWKVTLATEGQGGVPNANWYVYPNEVIPAGSYTVIDSDPATWAHNLESDGQGITIIWGIPADSGIPQGGGDVITAED